MNTPMIGDLHFHTTDSDGAKTNAETIQDILTLDRKKQGIWAVTNHDRFSPGFVEGARSEGLQALWATEISAHSDALDLSLHVTCYAPVLSEKIRSLIDIVVVGRQSKVLGQIEKLKNGGFPIDEGSFFSWIEGHGMSRDAATNWHIAEYICTKKDALPIVADLTNGAVKNTIDFLRECLRENGDFAHVGYHKVARYEPEIDTLAAIAAEEDIVLSVAHPNFSFTKKLQKEYHAHNSEERIRLFREKIVPIITEAGIRNYEINALALPHWVDVIRETTREIGGYITFGSDNHGLAESDSKHGILGIQNTELSREMSEPIIEKLRQFT